MKKYLLIVLPLMLAFVPMIIAASSFVNVVKNIDLFEKNPADWSIIDAGAYGELIISQVITNGKVITTRVRVSAFDLEPKTSYTLIYYGYDSNNDVWPYATCLWKQKTSTQGYFKSGSVKIPSDFLTDEIPQKFWVIKSSDVDCENNMMIAWNPTEYLFENETI